MSGDNGMPVERKNKNGAGRGSTPSCCEWFLHTGLWNLKGQRDRKWWCWKGIPNDLASHCYNHAHLSNFKVKCPLVGIHSTFSYNTDMECYRVAGIKWQNLGLKTLNKYYLNKTAPTPVGEMQSVLQWGHHEVQRSRHGMVQEKGGGKPISAVPSSYIICGAEAFKKTDIILKVLSARWLSN